MRRETLIFLVGMVVICLLGTVDLIQIPYPALYTIPIFLRAVLIIFPAAILTFFLILFLNRKKVTPISKVRFFALILVAVVGILIISNIASGFYYIGGAGYEYGNREIPSWIYALWGSIPTFLMLAVFYLALINLGIKSNRLSEDQT